ncbi:MAG: hypothetical protein AOA65_1952 [Candidatus Bathyarchaeota archaeon BA1]|nr:MAG: hypothetical protein AOA65_1952 [Candidatus Bathyarchaeota archaeon BA1]
MKHTKRRCILPPSLSHYQRSRAGQVAEKYVHEGRDAKDIEVDIADVVLVGLAYLNWLEKDATEAFKKLLAKHKKAIDLFKKRGR